MNILRETEIESRKILLHRCEVENGRKSKGIGTKSGIVRKRSI